MEIPAPASLNYVHYLAAVSKLVVVPHIQNGTLAFNDSGLRVNHTGKARTNQVAGYDFSRLGESIWFCRSECSAASLRNLFDIFLAGFGIKDQVDDRHGYIWWLAPE